MISLDHAKRSDRLIRATTSLTVLEFEDLVQRFAGAWSTVRAAKTDLWIILSSLLQKSNKSPSQKSTVAAPDAR
jgi:hypothetical protein